MSQQSIHLGIYSEELIAKGCKYMGPMTSINAFNNEIQETTHLYLSECNNIHTQALLFEIMHTTTDFHLLERWQFFIPLPFVYSYSFSMGWHFPPLPYLIHFWLIQNQLKLPLPLWSSSCPSEPHEQLPPLNTQGIPLLLPR